MNLCETCKEWEQQYIGSEFQGGLTAAKFDNDGENKNIITDYGECKKAISLYGRGETKDIENLMAIQIPMIIVDGEQYSGAWLYTNKDFCCRCYKLKEE